MDYKQLMEMILGKMEEGIIVIDRNFNITYYKEPSTDITGFDPSEAIGKNLYQVFPHIKKDESTFSNVMKTGKPIIEQVQNYINYKGKSVSILSSTMPIYEDEKLVGAFEIFKDLTNIRELSEKVLMLQKELYGKSLAEDHKATNGTQYIFSDIIGESPAMMILKNKILKVAESNSPVFIYGETGTGKELIVQSLHNLSSRSQKPFIAQNCAALPENLLESILFGTVRGSFTGANDRPGLFELADGGTLFLDEINSMNLALQSKLLRVLQDGVIRRVGGATTKAVDVRIITATNLDPKTMLENNIMRKDLFYRLNVIFLYVPSLRERRADIPLLANHFIKTFNKRLGKNIKGLTRDVLEQFIKSQWQGNVRELENIIESALNFAEGDYLTLKDLQYYSIFGQSSSVVKTSHVEIPQETGLKNAVEEYEKSLIMSTLEKAGGNRAKAARMLSIPKQTLHGKLKKYNIENIEKK